MPDPESLTKEDHEWHPAGRKLVLFNMSAKFGSILAASGGSCAVKPRCDDLQDELELQMILHSFACS